MIGWTDVQPRGIDLSLFHFLYPIISISLYQLATYAFHFGVLWLISGTLLLTLSIHLHIHIMACETRGVV